MFHRISKIKDIRLLNASLKEARAKSDYEKSVLATKQAEDVYLSFKVERESLEGAIVSEVIGSVVTQSDLDEMNEKINALRNQESQLAISFRDKKNEESEAKKYWELRLVDRGVAQKGVDKFKIVCEMEDKRISLHKQYLEDLELEEFKPISKVDEVNYE